MTNAEAVNWLINITADIGKAEHSDLWHYEQALSEIREMLEDAQPQRKPGKTLAEEVERIKREITDIFAEQMSVQPAQEIVRFYNPYADEALTSFCPWCGAEMEVE